MLDGLEEGEQAGCLEHASSDIPLAVCEELEQLQVPFVLMHGAAADNIPKLATELEASLVVSDLSPLRIGELWRKDVGGKLQKRNISMHEVDAHNVVPVWIASDKIEYAARTIRAKLHARLPQYLVDFPRLQKQSRQIAELCRWHTPDGLKSSINWAHVRELVTADPEVLPVQGMTPGAQAAKNQLKTFLGTIEGYASTRNDPTLDSVSGISPYLHFGQLSAQRAILHAKEARTASNAKDVDSFIEEALVRRELSENYCFYNQAGYDKLGGLYPQYANDSWAQKSLRVHASDVREHVYTVSELEAAKTHDELWNAAQLEMAYLGKMHGFMRMYWAKKILEWTSCPEAALDAAIYLNDKYSIDGRDPNGYVGIAWSIAGVHDQGWKERPVFGKVRYMNLAGCHRKFDVKLYIHKVQSAISKLKL